MRTSFGAAGLSMALVLSTAAVAQKPAAKSVAPVDNRPRIDVVFVLDTTGSMGGLVDDLKEGRAKLGELKKDELPAELNDKTPEQQKAYLAQQGTKRKQLQAQVAELVKKRQAYVDAEMKKAAAEGKGSAFDVEVARTLKEQAKRKKIAFGTGL